MAKAHKPSNEFAGTPDKLKQHIIELEASISKYKNLCDNIKSGVVIYEAIDNGEDFIIRDINCAVEQIEKVKRKAVIGRRVSEAFPGVKNFGLFDIFQRVWKTGQPEHHPASHYSDGRISGWRDNQVYKLPTGEIIAVYYDITEQKRTEEELKESEEKYRLLTENSITGIAIIQDGKYVYVNANFAEMHGYKPHELLGMEYWKLLHPDYIASSKENTGKLLTGAITQSINVRKRLRKDGQVIWVELLGSHIHYKGKPAVMGNLIDITEQVKVDEELKLRALLLDTANDSVFAYEFDTGKFIYANEMTYKSRGYTRDEMMGMKFFQIVTTENMKVIEKRRQNLLASGGHTFESAHLCKDGSTVPLEVKSRLIEWDGTKYVLTVARDISDRKKAEQELKESEEKYRVLAESSLTGIAIVQDGKFVYVNTRFAEIHGYQPAELLGMERGKLTHPDESEISEKTISSQLKGEIGQINTIRKRLRKDGQVFWVEILATNMKFRGKPATLANVIDITERIKAEAELKRGTLLLDSANDAIFLYDFDGNFLYVNRVMCTMHGYSREELMGMKLSRLLTPENANGFGRRRKVLLEKGSNIFEVEQIRKDGSVVPLEIRSQVIEVSGTKLILSVGRDITERKRMEEEIIRSQKLDSIGILAGGIAHDFNNILTGIMGNIGIARMEMESETEMAQRLGEAEKACLRAKDLTQQLLTFARGGAPVKKATSISDVLRETATFALRGSRSVPELSLPDSLWSLEADKGQISQVINNLVINAQQAMPKGGAIKITAENTMIKAEHGIPLEEGNYIKITVADQGIGIPKEHLDKIFDPYFSTKAAGRGLGLATSYSIIRNHKGMITVASELGAGTTFTIYLPSSGQKPVEKKGEKNGQVCVKGRILVMDDEAVIRDVASRMLKHLGCEEIITAIDGAEAVVIYREAFDSGNRFDAVIMDLTIPGGMGGKEAIEKLLEIDPAVNAIVSSGYANDPIMAEYKKYGFSAVVTKPYNLGDLSNALGEVLTKEQ
jgi:PAS domain S-box-containing protein